MIDDAFNKLFLFKLYDIFYWMEIENFHYYPKIQENSFHVFLSCYFLHYLDRIDIELKWKNKLIISFRFMFAKYTICEKNNVKCIKYKIRY